MNSPGPPQLPQEDEIELTLFVKWHLEAADASGGTKIKVNRLKLKQLENVDKLGKSWTHANHAWRYDGPLSYVLWHRRLTSI